MIQKFKKLMLGAPLPSSKERHERLGIPLGLAVFASDTLSSSAYATEEILIALVGSSYALYANALAIPVAIGIALLLTIVVISYRQVIMAYPQSGGAYVVAKENLGTMASLVAAAALLIDYVLTVAVSISAGVAALTSTGWLPMEHKVSVALWLTLVMTYFNLRGLRESGKVIAVPAYLFILAMFILLGCGYYQWWQGAVVPVPVAPAAGAPPSLLDAAMWFALMGAFSHGCAALTGTEAISNGVQAFKAPEATNANRTMVIMALLLGVIFVGLTGLAWVFHIQPSHTETVVSQVARAVFGGNSLMYFYVQISTMVILILAANTSYSGFPRLASLLAHDGFLPRQLASLGDKLVFSNGIILLGVVASLLMAAYNADTHALIPLYAVGVFVTFTLAQAGMVVYHRKHPGQHNRFAGWMNAFGAAITGLVALLLMEEKFTEGAWIIIAVTPVIIWMFFRISEHYKSVGRQLALPNSSYCPTPIHHTVLVLVSSLNRGTIPALEYAKTISDRVEAVHVELSHQKTESLKKQWDEWGCGIPLTILKSPYRSFVEPLLDYIREVETRHEHDLVTIIVPQFVTKHWWHNLLHNQSATLIKAILRFEKNKVVTTVRYHLKE